MVYQIRNLRLSAYTNQQHWLRIAISFFISWQAICPRSHSYCPSEGGFWCLGTVITSIVNPLSLISLIRWQFLLPACFAHAVAHPLLKIVISLSWWFIKLPPYIYSQFYFLNEKAVAYRPSCHLLFNNFYFLYHTYRKSNFTETAYFPFTFTKHWTKIVGLLLKEICVLD